MVLLELLQCAPYFRAALSPGATFAMGRRSAFRVLIYCYYASRKGAPLRLRVSLFLDLCWGVPSYQLLGDATEQLSFSLGQTLAGIVNASFGNAVEIIVGIAALLRGALYPLCFRSLLIQYR